MIVILDANILLRLAEPTAVLHPVAVSAVSTLRQQGHSLHTIPQAVYEFWVVATRPIGNNGLGLSTVEAEDEVTALEISFPLLPDQAGLYTEWRTLATTYDCKGKVAHDARIAAALHTHGLTHLLTFNVADFARFTSITTLDPAALPLSLGQP